MASETTSSMPEQVGPEKAGPKKGQNMHVKASIPAHLGFVEPTRVQATAGISDPPAFDGPGPRFDGQVRRHLATAPVALGAFGALVVGVATASPAGAALPSGFKPHAAAASFASHPRDMVDELGQWFVDRNGTHYVPPRLKSAVLASWPLGFEAGRQRRWSALGERIDLALEAPPDPAGPLPVSKHVQLAAASTARDASTTDAPSLPSIAAGPSAAASSGSAAPESGGRTGAGAHGAEPVSPHLDDPIAAEILERLRADARPPIATLPFAPNAARDANAGASGKNEESAVEIEARVEEAMRARKSAPPAAAKADAVAPENAGSSPVMGQSPAAGSGAADPRPAVPAAAPPPAPAPAPADPVSGRQAMPSSVPAAESGPAPKSGILVETAPEIEPPRDLSIAFERESAEVDPDLRAELAAFAQTLALQPGLRAISVGYASVREGESAADPQAFDRARRLAESRAIAMRQMLLELGAPPAKVAFEARVARGLDIHSGEVAYRHPPAANQAAGAAVPSTAQRGATMDRPAADRVARRRTADAAGAAAGAAPGAAAGGGGAPVPAAASPRTTPAGGGEASAPLLPPRRLVPSGAGGNS
jgi:outer membrane protein OmpA-like peptidoglycan-associated protein